MWRIFLLLAALGLGACGYRGAQSPTYYDYGAQQNDSFDGDMLVSQTVSLESTGSTRSERNFNRGGRSQGSFAAGVMMAEPSAPPMQTSTPPAFADDGTANDGSAPSAPGAGPLLIYNGSVVLAVFDVEAKQTEAIAMIEQMGGFAAQRSATSLTFRVPAERFRDALDALSALGDVLSVDWRADDVSEEYRDLDIRLQNSLQMRARLEELLTQAQTVEEALAIEAELERVTLEIERIRGRLRSLEDMIAYSTIVLSFQETYVAGVPEAAYRLPFNWLNTLGLPNLLSLY